MFFFALGNFVSLFVSLCLSKPAQITELLPCLACLPCCSSLLPACMDTVYVGFLDVWDVRVVLLVDVVSISMKIR